jgi:hypothetical protein
MDYDWFKRKEKTLESGKRKLKLVIFHKLKRIVALQFASAL